MLAPQERLLLIAIGSVLMVGIVVKSCRHQVVVRDIPATRGEELEPPPPPADESE